MCHTRRFSRGKLFYVVALNLMRNNTLNCSPKEIKTLLREVHHLSAKSSVKQIDGKLICGDIFIIAESLPCSFVDLLILDPPYNLSKNYNGTLFKAKEEHNYRQWFEGCDT